MVHAEMGLTYPAECISVPFEYRLEFWNWCQKNQIECEYQGSHTYSDPIDEFRIADEKHRAWAKLRWS